MSRDEAGSRGEFSEKYSFSGVIWRNLASLKLIFLALPAFNHRYWLLQPPHCGLWPANQPLKKMADTFRIDMKAEAPRHPVRHSTERRRKINKHRALAEILGVSNFVSSVNSCRILHSSLYFTTEPAILSAHRARNLSGVFIGKPKSQTPHRARDFQITPKKLPNRSILTTGPK
jgi:hypothetical protein